MIKFYLIENAKIEKLNFYFIRYFVRKHSQLEITKEMIGMFKYIRLKIM